MLNNLLKSLQMQTASKRAILKTLKANGNLIVHEGANKVTKALRTLPQNSYEAVE